MAWYLFKLDREKEDQVNYSICTCVDVHVPLFVTRDSDIADRLSHDGSYEELHGVECMRPNDMFFRIMKTSPDEKRFGDLQEWVADLPVNGHVWWFPMALHGGNLYSWFEDPHYQDLMMIKWGDCFNG